MARLEGGSNTQSGPTCIRCRTCEREILFCDDAVDHDAGAVLKSFLCPFGHGSFKKTELQWLRPNRYKRTSALRGKRPDSCVRSSLWASGTESIGTTSLTGTRAFPGNGGARCGEPSTKFKALKLLLTSSRPAICTRCQDSGTQSETLTQSRFVLAFGSCSPPASTVPLIAISGTRGGRPMCCLPPCT